jgi:hypothetical protein
MQIRMRIHANSYPVFAIVLYCARNPSSVVDIPKSKSTDSTVFDMTSCLFKVPDLLVAGNSVMGPLY